MSSVAESKVSGIIKSLGELEEDLDSLNGKVEDMKRQMYLKTTSKIDSMLEKTRDMATKEAEAIIDAAKEQATAESAKIEEEGQSKLAEIQSSIDANFDKAVSHVVLTVLKP